MAIDFAVQENPSPLTRLLAALLGCVITSSLLLVTSVLGPVAAVMNVILAFPLAYVGMRFGVISAVAGLLLTAVLQLVVGGNLAAGIYVVQFGMATVVLPWLLTLGLPWLRSVLICSVLTMILAVGTLGGYASHQQASMTQVVHHYIDQEVDAARAVYAKAELPKNQLDQMYQVLDSTADFFRQAFWGLAMTAFMLLSLVTVGLLKVAPKRNYAVPGCLFHYFKVSEYLVWVLIGAGFALLLDNPLVQLVALNVLTVILPLYFLQGVAIVTFFFRKKSFSTLSRTFGYLLIVAINPLPLLVTAMGVFDMWFDFRKPRVKTT